MKLITSIAFPLASALTSAVKRTSAEINADIKAAKAVCTKFNANKWVTFLDSYGVRKIAIIVGPVSKIWQGGCKMKIRIEDTVAHLEAPKFINWKNLHKMTSAADYCATPEGLPLCKSSYNDKRGACEFVVQGKKTVLIPLLDLPAKPTLVSERIRCMTGDDGMFVFKSAGNGHCTFLIGNEKVFVPIPAISDASSFLEPSQVRLAAAKHFCVKSLKGLQAGEKSCKVVVNGASLSLFYNKFVFTKSGFDSDATKSELDKLAQFNPLQLAKVTEDRLKAQADIEKKIYVCKTHVSSIKPCPGCSPRRDSCSFALDGIIVNVKFTEFPMANSEVDVTALNKIIRDTKEAELKTRGTEKKEQIIVAIARDIAPPANRDQSAAQETLPVVAMKPTATASQPPQAASPAVTPKCKKAERLICPIDGVDESVIFWASYGKLCHVWSHSRQKSFEVDVKQCKVEVLEKPVEAALVDSTGSSVPASEAKVSASVSPTPPAASTVPVAPVAPPAKTADEEAKINLAQVFCKRTPYAGLHACKAGQKSGVCHPPRPVDSCTFIVGETTVNVAFKDFPVTGGAVDIPSLRCLVSRGSYVFERVEDGDCVYRTTDNTLTFTVKSDETLTPAVVKKKHTVVAAAYSACAKAKVKDYKFEAVAKKATCKVTHQGETYDVPFEVLPVPIDSAAVNKLLKKMIKKAK